MPNEKKDRRPNDGTSPGLSRRDFIAFAAGFTATAADTTSDREQPIVDIDAEVKTPDGNCDAVFIHPAQGSHPGVLLWHDSPGLRPVIRDLGKRIAAEGYSVLLLGHASVQTTERYLGCKQKLRRAVNDNLGLEDV